MKVIGAELVNFACFDRQFIPLRSGISVLVGRNNSGKTAILRGLASLHTMPVGQQKPNLPTPLAGYFKNGNSGELELLCAIEDSETEHLQRPGTARELEEYNHWLEGVFKKGIARWHFTVTEAGLAFNRCRFELPPSSINPRTLDVILREGAGASSQILRFPTFSSAGRRQITTRQGGSGGPVFDLGSPVSAPLESVSNVRLVDPHRVVQDSQILQTTTHLPTNAANLAQYLQTLSGNDRDTFLAIEKFVTEVFPEFRYVNAVSGPNNQVSIELTESKTNRKIRLPNSGTGVEQILTLATFVLTMPKPGIILLDEPHSYLHPTAERALVEFLKRHSEHTYLISTHSSVLMNSVEPERIVYISPPGRAYPPRQHHRAMSAVLFDLGYRNSDSLFHDRLIFVEGKSDKAIIPILLLADGEIPLSELDRTGFPVLEGVGRGSRALQTSIFRYENLLSTVGRADQPRMYIFDGDRREDEKTVLRGTNSPVTGEPIKAEFLVRLEIENYLLVPEAIAAAIREEFALKGEQREVETPDIEALVRTLLASEEGKLFPQGKEAHREVVIQIKASRALEQLYDGFGLSYNKERSGILIAKHISAKNQPALTELADIVRPLFAKAVGA